MKEIKIIVKGNVGDFVYYFNPNKSVLEKCKITGVSYFLGERGMYTKSYRVLINGSEQYLDESRVWASKDEFIEHAVNKTENKKGE